VEPASGGETAVAEEYLVLTIYPVLGEFEDASEIASSAARLLAVPRLSDTVTSDGDGVMLTFCSELESRFTFLRKKLSRFVGRDTPTFIQWRDVHYQNSGFKCSWGFEVTRTVTLRPRPIEIEASTYKGRKFYVSWTSDA
jgi:hypothetical protein